ncbi:hypothetical protein O181_020313 [Austropuccinia psidii MF-1]|uniref:Uncharacterized protein n=1 Tax=Austropuccinia psidii MF-1 TaxID=1389203 RepID=A0A9Q3CCP1_9BASI|nr:hypothetical protein [Austropuccinia psidii MF-1]
MSPAYLRDLGFQRNQPEDREGLSRTRRTGRGYLGHSGGWKNTEGNHTHTAIHFPIQQEPQTRGLERLVSSSTAPQLLKDFFQWSMENKRFNLAFHWAELGASFQNLCLKEIDFKDLMIITKVWNPTRQFRLLEVRENRLRENQATIQAIEEQLTQKGHIQIP